MDCSIEAFLQLSKCCSLQARISEIYGDDRACGKSYSSLDLTELYPCIPSMSSSHVCNCTRLHYNRLHSHSFASSRFPGKDSDTRTFIVKQCDLHAFVYNSRKVRRIFLFSLNLYPIVSDERCL